jgi:hypothetical protein
MVPNIVMKSDVGQFPVPLTSLVNYRKFFNLCKPLKKEYTYFTKYLSYKLLISIYTYYQQNNGLIKRKREKRFLIYNSVSQVLK